MATKKYLYQDTTGEWIYGMSQNSICPAGAYRLEIRSDNISVISISGDLPDRYSATYSDFLNSAGTAYASTAAFVAATKGFFSSGSDSLTTIISELGDVNTALESLTDGTQETKLVDESGNFLHPSGTPYVESAEITRLANTTAYDANDAVNSVAAVAQVETVSLSGTPPAKKKDEVTLTGASGTAEITVAGGLTKTVTFATGGTMDLSQTALDFATAFAADYLAQGIVVTSDAAKIVFEASDYGIPFDSPVITNVTGDLAGTVANTVANIVVGSATITGVGGLSLDVVFDTAGAVTLEATATNFVTAYESDYATEGITLTSSGNDLIFTAAVAGTPFTAPSIANVTGDLTGSIAHTAANVTPVSIEFQNMAIANGGGGYLAQVRVESNITAMAGKSVRLWFYNEAPTYVQDDNTAFTHYYVDRDKRLFYIDVTMNALLGTSDTVIGETLPLYELYKCADTSLFVAVQTLSAFTPTSGGKINITLIANKLS